MRVKRKTRTRGESHLLHSLSRVRGQKEKRKKLECAETEGRGGIAPALLATAVRNCEFLGIRVVRRCQVEGDAEESADTGMGNERGKDA